MQTQHGRTLTMDQRTHDQGRHERFAELYAAHYRPLVAFCRRLVGREPEAEELAQEAFLRAWASWDRYAPSRPFWPWVSTIARRLCIDHGRRVHLARRKGPSSGDRHAPSPEELVETDEEYRWARAALAELRPDHRRVLRLREVEGWSYDRIADHEGVSVESVRGSLRRVRVGLRAAYARMVSSWPVIVVLALVRGIRRHVDWSVQRLQHAAADGAPIGSRASDTVAALLALALGTGAAAVPMASGVPAPAGSAGRTGTVVATAAGENGSSAALGSAAGSSTTTTAAVGQDDGAGRRTARDGDQHPLPVIVPGRGPGVPEGSNFESFT
ncbi:MAG TPA: sigma-70 family RNA polymerase sigma factor, partial [Acidimicrobiia bacterium]|nr:sigma-70 family RNA polymerase sigma factor [Acidimicrobiia bacterium]